jgi:hypothetical protein
MVIYFNEVYWVLGADLENITQNKDLKLLQGLE